MALDANENGYKFLLDAKSGRQYLVRWEQGDIADERPAIFSADGKAVGLLDRNEVVFALDDAPVFEVRNGQAVMSVTAYQFSADATGLPKDVKYRSVDYELVVLPAGKDRVEVSYILSKDSFAELRGDNKDSTVQGGLWKLSDFPVHFSQELDPREIDGNQIDMVALRNLPFPPHHPDGKALYARASVEMSPPAPAATTTVVVAPAPAKEAFNQVARPMARIPAPPARPQVPDIALEKLLKEYTSDLTEEAREGRSDAILDRDRETQQALSRLIRREDASLCFVGEAGVGKTAMFHAVAQRIASGDVPPLLRDARILSLDLTKMNSGPDAKFRGAFEGKIKPLIDGLKERQGYFRGRKIILAIDEIHSQLTAGKAEGATDAGQIMKPFLNARGIAVMGTTTADEYKKHIEKDPALSRRFRPVTIGSTSNASTVRILGNVWSKNREHFGFGGDLTAEDYAYFVTMTDRFMPNSHQPDKAKAALDTACAGAYMRGSMTVDRQDINAAVAQTAGVPEDMLNHTDAERLLRLKQDMPKAVLGQPHALEKLVKGTIGAFSGLNDPGQPRGCYVFRGPTGTGKTEAAKALARALFGSEEALIKLDMGEYSEKHTVARLIGSPPGYVGHEDSPGQLTEKVSRKPYCVLLLDEIEKAHPDVFNVLLPILNDGKMTDNKGKVVSFNNVIIVMTTNLGAREVMAYLENGKGGMGFNTGESSSGVDRVEKDLDALYDKAGTQYFNKPEIVNRIKELGGFVTFVPLEREVITSLVDRQVGETAANLAALSGAGLTGLQLEVSQGVRDQLAQEGYDRANGARPLRGVVRRRLNNALGEWVMENRVNVEAFIAENGGKARLVVDSLDSFGPKLEKLSPAPILPVAAVETDVAANDDAKKQVSRKKKRAGGGPAR